MVTKPLLLNNKNFIKYDMTYVTIFYGKKTPNLPIWRFGAFRLSTTPEADNRQDNHDQQDQNHCYNDPCYSPITQTLL